jgi:hypothetical protein
MSHRRRAASRSAKAGHVFADSFCFACGLSPDLAVDVEACVAPVMDLPHQGDPDKLFPQQQGEDLMGEDLLDNLVMETRDTAKRTIRGCASLVRTAERQSELRSFRLKRKKRRNILGIVKTT